MSGTWASGWATNDVVSAAEFAKGFGSIYDTTLGVGAANIDITGITGLYAHLLIVAYLRSDTAAFSTDLVLRFNGDSGGNYNANNNGSATSIGAGTGANAAIAAASATASMFSAFAIFIPHYAGTANFKSAILPAFDVSSTSLVNGVTRAGVWKSTSAINRITISAAAGNLVTGSRLSLFVMGA